MMELQINPDRLADFVTLLLPQLAGAQSKTALWFYAPLDLPLAAQAIGSASPFIGSSGILAGHGYLLDLSLETAQALSAFLAHDTQALSALTHLEVEVSGQLQFCAYDHFTVLIPGDALHPPWFAALAEQEILVLPGQ